MGNQGRRLSNPLATAPLNFNGFPARCLTP